MSEPITLTERERAVFGSMIEYVRERCRNNARDGNQASGNAVSRWMEDWLASQPTESASPPRVPGASAQLAREGVESGPGQPIPPHVPDVADALDGWAAQYSEPENINARHLREAAAEIRRLREQVKTERRAGIEAAATHLAATTATRHLADEVRARADAPAPDTKPMTFDQFVAEINRLAEREGATKPGKPYCDAEAWRQAYDDGCTPADAWEEEKQAGV